MSTDFSWVPSLSGRFGRRSVLARMALSSLLLLSAVGGCRPNTVSSIAWSEEVQLSTGRLVVGKSTAEWARRGGGYRVQLGSTLQIMDTPGVPMWSEPMLALILDVDSRTGEYLIVATTENLEALQSTGRPTPPYWQFRLRSGRWVEEPVATTMWDRSSNMLLATNNPPAHHVISLAEKQTLTAAVRLPACFMRIMQNVNIYTCDGPFDQLPRTVD